MNQQGHTTDNWKQASSRAKTRLGMWTAAWVSTMALATFGPMFLWGPSTSLTLAAILLNTVLGVGMIIADMRYLITLDEMHQRVHLDAMAIALGVTIVAGLAYSNLDIANIIAADAEIANLVMLTGLTYLSAMFFGLRRLR